MKKWMVALAMLSLAACDVRQAVTGKEYQDTAEYNTSGGFWGMPNAQSAPTPVAEPAKPTEVAKASDYIQNASADDYKQPAAAAPVSVETAQSSDYFTTVDAADYDPPVAPEPVAAPLEPDEDDVLMIPKRAAAAPKAQAVPQKQNLITVEKGDTLYSLARKHNVPLRDLITANKLEAPYALNPGRTLYLPDNFVHTVAKGETLYSISRLYQMDLNSLAQMNNLKAPYALSVGQKLTLPAQIQLTAAAAPASTTPETAAAKKEEPKKEESKTESKTETVSVKPTPAPVSKPANVSSLPKVPASAGGKFAWPLKGRILSTFGAKPNGLYNDGINIAAARGAPVSAADNGVVAYAGNEIKGLGNLVIIKHANNFMTVYAHLDTILVERGKTVAKGAKIGSAGATGKVSSPQLHFEVRQGTRALNPTNHLTK